MPEPRTAIQLPTLLEGFPDPVFVIEPGGRIAAANMAGIRFTGHEPAVLFGLATRDLLTPHTHAAFLTQLRTVQTSFTVAGEWQLASGEIAAVDIFGATAEGGLVQIIVRETAGRRRVEEALRHSESRFRFMTKN